MENSVYTVPGYSYCYGVHQYVAVLTAALTSLSIGMHYGWPSPTLPLLLAKNSTIQITDSDGSWIVVMPLMGLPFGGLICAAIVDIIGRKACLLISSSIILLPWLIIAYAGSVLSLECARFVLGIADGIAGTALTMYVGEVADKNSRGFLGCSSQIATKLGLLLINVIGLHFDIRTTAIVASVIPILHFTTFIWMPESPYFYILRNRQKNAAKSLQKFSGKLNVEMEISNLEASIIPNSKNSWKLLAMARNKINRRAIAVVLGLKLVEQLSGFIAIEFYCLTIFNEAGGSVKGSAATAIYLGVQVVVTILSGCFSEKVGRKPLLIISIIGSGCSLALEGIYFYCKTKTNMDLSKFGFLPLTALVMYIISFSLGLSTIPTLMSAEVFPTKNKALSVCIATISFSVYATVVSKFFQITKDGYGMHVPFFSFAIFCALGLIFTIFYVPETKRRTLEQIQEQWATLLSETRKTDGQLDDIHSN